MPVVVLKVVALVFQRAEGLIFDLLPGSSTPHELIHVALAHAEIGHPTEVLDLCLTYLPVFDVMMLLANSGHFVSERTGVYSAIKNRAEERL